MKTSRACTGMLSSENDDFKFLKTAKNIKKHVHHVYHTSRAGVLSLQTSPSLTRIMNVKVAIELYYIFSKISNLDTGNFSLTLSIYYTVELPVNTSPQ